MLKPCPFCGVTPVIEQYALEDRGPYYVECQNPECHAAPDVGGLTREEAIAAWNTRPTPADVERLKSRITELEDALRWFCGRVEKGEVISKRTYELFKALLNRIGGE